MRNQINYNCQEFTPECNKNSIQFKNRWEMKTKMDEKIKDVLKNLM